MREGSRAAGRQSRPSPQAELERLRRPDGPEVTFRYRDESRHAVVVAWGEIVRGWDVEKRDWRAFRRAEMQKVEWV